MSVPMYAQASSDPLFEMVAGDGGTLLDLSLFDLQDKIVDLSTAATAWVRFKVGDGAVQVKQMAIAMPEYQGRVYYQFAAADTLNQSGLCQFEVFTKDSNGNVLNTQLTPGLFRVRAPLS